MARFAGTNCDFGVQQAGSNVAAAVLLPTENWELMIEEIADDITNSRSGLLEEDLFIRYRWTVSADLILDKQTTPALSYFPHDALAILGGGIVNQRALVRLYVGDRLDAASFTDFWTGVIRLVSNQNTSNVRKGARCRIAGKGLSILYAPGAAVPGAISTTNYATA